jgi:hypothetical protein
MPKFFAVCCLEVVIGMIYDAAPELRSVQTLFHVVFLTLTLKVD